MINIAHQYVFQKCMYQNPMLFTFPTTEILDVCERAGQIWVCGKNGFVAKSTNGTSWTTFNLTSLIGWTGDVNVVFGSHGWFPNQWRVWGVNNQQAYTTDGGVTWVTNNMTTTTPQATVTDVDETGGYLIACSFQGQIGVNVSGDMNGMGLTGAGDSWLTCARDPSDATLATLGVGNKIYISVFGWPPPAGHLITSYTKGTTSNTLGVYFDSSKNMMFINADGTYGYKNQPGYSTTTPTIYNNITLNSGTLNGLTHDRVNKNEWMICGAKGGTDRLWASTQASPHIWTELNPYFGYGVAAWNRVDRDDTRGTWVTGGKTTGGVGCVGIWKV